MFIINSNKAENIKVESAEKPKNGKPNKYADNNPSIPRITDINEYGICKP